MRSRAPVDRGAAGSEAGASPGSRCCALAERSELDDVLLRAAERAGAEIDQGSDVVYAAAGGTGVGVLQAAADAGKLGIGVDSNQNGLQPGKVLTSMLKRVDVAVYDSFVAGKDGSFQSGINVLGLKEGGVDYAMDDNNKSLVSEDMMKAVEDAKAKIIAGEIEVHDYMSDNACPY